MQQLTIATVAFVGLIVDSIVKSIFLDFELDAVQSLHLYNFTVGAYLHHDINDTEINHTAMPRVRGGKCKNHVKIESQQKKKNSIDESILACNELSNFAQCCAREEQIAKTSKEKLFFSLKRQTITFHFSFQQNMTTCEIMIDIIRSLFLLFVVPAFYALIRAAAA